MRRKELLLLLIILVLGAFLRFYHITTIPPGLYPDEAMNGNNALEALHTGNFHVFYPENNGREGLFINIQAISVWLFGREPWALRIISAIFGTFTILGIYLVAKELFKNYTIALLAAFFTATSYWHLNFSRIGFRAITTPFFLVFGLYFLLRGFRRNSIWDMVWAGISIGLGFQGYIAFRFAPFVLAVPILWQLIHWWHARSEPRTFAADFRSKTGEQQAYGASAEKGSSCTPCAIVLFFFITFVAALPIGWYFLKHPADFIGRSKEVSILSTASPIREFVKTNALTLGMFFIRGDCNDRHNYACKPELNLMVAVFFVIGFISIIRNWKLGIENSTTLAWLVFMSLPETLTREGIPHALRSIGMIPPIMILAGLGAYAVFGFVKDRISQKTILALVLLLCGYITFQTYHDYFIAWAARPQTADAFGADTWHLGQYLDTTPANIKKYVIVNLNGDLIRGIPAPAQTVMFATDTFRPEEQTQKNVVYSSFNSHAEHSEASLEILRSTQDDTSNIPTIIIPLNKNDANLISIIREKFPQFREIPHTDFLIFQNF